MEAVQPFVAALSWTQRRPQGMSSDSCTRHGSLFFLDLGGPTFAVTADHVLADYLWAKKDDSGLSCAIGGLALCPEERIIDRDHDLDLATFGVSRAELAGIGKQAYGCPAAFWPPAPPRPEERVFVAGFLRNGAEVDKHGAPRFRTTFARARVSDVNDRHVACTFDSGESADPTGRSTPTGRAPVLRGASGAPLWASADGPLVPWRPAGIVKKCLEQQGILVAIRPDVISPDGTLIRWA